MKEKIPCIECNDELWEYIEPHLKEWKYYIDTIIDIDNYPLIVINYNNLLGEVINTSTVNYKYNDRELVTNVEEFLERAAKLRGFTYKRKDIMKINGVEIKTGMVIKTKEENNVIYTYIVFPLLNNTLGVMAYDKTSWDTIENFITFKYSKIIAIYDLIPAKSNFLYTGKLLWDKSKEVELTMQEIADKFGVPVEQLKIKK